LRKSDFYQGGFIILFYPVLLQGATSEKIFSASENATKTVFEMINSFWAQLPVVGVGLVVFVIFLVLASIVRKIILMASGKTHLDIMLSSLLARIGYFATVVIGFFVASVVIFPGLSPGDLVAGLGIGSVALGFAFKDVLQNLFAGFLLLLYRPFHLGDQIKVKDYEGTVEDINIRATKIKTYDGERVVIPNSELYLNPVLVRTAFPARRTKIVIGIGYADDIEKARSVMLDVLKNTEGVLDEPAPAVDVYELGESSVNMRLLFWSKPVQTEVRQTSNRVVTGIKKALDAEGIDMPYPHRVLQFADDRVRVESLSENGAGGG
jgi:small-conductance mechanosensitive channel